MKVLFAVSNENISESIIKKYQKQYKEIITYKNVYYFNAIIKEIQKDKTYDRIVISEDLEPFANNNYDVIDKFLFEKLDSISDEATDSRGNDTQIILICTDRRTKGDEILVKLFGIGIYNALLGQDRSIEEVCKLLYHPRTKKEAKQYYKIDSEDVTYQSENENEVSEVEIQNILSHYKRLGKNTDKYISSFDNIASQYTDSQLKAIIKFLPLNVKAVLEAESQKYQELMTFGVPYEQQTKSANKKGSKATKASKKNAKSDSKIEFIENQFSKPKLTKPVVIPEALNTAQVKKVGTKFTPEEVPEKIISARKEKVEEPEEIEEMMEKPVVEKPKRGRGRPKKVKVEEPVEENEEIEEVIEKPKRGRGRPKKVKVEEPVMEPEEIDEEEESYEDEDEVQDIFHQSSEPAPVNLFDLTDDEDEEEEEEYENEETTEEPYSPPSYQTNQRMAEPRNTYQRMAEPQEVNEISNVNYRGIENFDGLNSVLSKDQKIVSFVGTTKNGTSFIVNNLATLFASMGVKTAILDMTESKNSYYIYTKNDEDLRKVAFDSIDKLKSNRAEGIQVMKNLDVYTSLPGQEGAIDGDERILETLASHYSLILIDCDFNTPLEYFASSGEIYLVQSMDVLTIQPLTAFLRNLKSKGILKQEKIRVVINKELKVRSLSAKTIIGGMSFYNDPAMSFMTELFDRATVKYYTIPFEEQTYSKYLEALVNCSVSLNGYSKNFMASLKELAGGVYPLLGKPSNQPKDGKYKSGFSSNMNNTLNQMKKKY